MAVHVALPPSATRSSALHRQPSASWDEFPAPALGDNGLQERGDPGPAPAPRAQVGERGNDSRRRWGFLALSTRALRRGIAPCALAPPRHLTLPLHPSRLAQPAASLSLGLRRPRQDSAAHCPLLPPPFSTPPTSVAPTPGPRPACWPPEEVPTL